MTGRTLRKAGLLALGFVFCLGFVLWHPGAAQEQEEYEKIDNSSCATCHEKTSNDMEFAAELESSVHSGFECLDCHVSHNTFPHHSEASEFKVGCKGCATCHESEAEQYKVHGRENIDDCVDTPSCANCHGTHDVLLSSDERSKTYPANLPHTCAVCHEDINLTQKYEILIDHPVQIYESSIHGHATQEEGKLQAATCNDCHSTNGTAHLIYAPSFPQSTINHFNIPGTCGKCHTSETKDYSEGIHGKLAARNETDSPVCTTCHGEHGIISPKDPRSPVSRIRVAEATCTPCHESITLTEKYGLETGRLTSFIDSYHGLKSKTGDLHVANCASCHGFHKILPSRDPNSTINPDNLRHTCGQCHPTISAELAQKPIHGVGGQGLRTKVGDIVAQVYILAIFIIIGLMALHWLIDFIKQIILIMKKPQVRRMRWDEVVQHALLTLSFIVLVITGFALRYGDSWFAQLFFGWEGGFALRGLIHRIAAVFLIVSTIWHFFFLFTKRGRYFLKDMMPKFYDFKDFVHRIFYNLGLSKTAPRFKRFSYIEKAEYWALIWGNIVMILSGLMLWFDNTIIRFLPKGSLDVALIVHFYEAILASLAILIWHMYSTVFNPRVYPMNPSWLTGKMPRDMFEHEHPEAEAEEV